MPSRNTPKLWFSTPADIVARRKEMGLTQAEFWARVGVTQSGGCRYEISGRDIPKPVTLLLEVAYGTETQARAMVAYIRRGLETYPTPAADPAIPSRPSDTHAPSGAAPVAP